MLSINTNMASIIVANGLQKTQASMATSMELMYHQIIIHLMYKV